MKATHTDYKNPRHLRVVCSEGFVACMAPSHSQYSRLNKPSLPSHSKQVFTELSVQVSG